MRKMDFDQGRIRACEGSRWQARQSVIDAAQREALLAMLRQQPDVAETVLDIQTLYYDTQDGVMMRRMLAGAPFAEMLALETEDDVLTGDSTVRLMLYRRIGEIWMRRVAEISLRDVELFWRAGIRPPALSPETAQVLVEVAAHRLRQPVRPSMVVCSRQRCLVLEGGLRVYLEESLKARRMALTLEAGNYGNPVLEEGHALLRIHTPQGIPRWLAEALEGLSIRCCSIGMSGIQKQMEKKAT